MWRAAVQTNCKSLHPGVHQSGIDAKTYHFNFFSDGLGDLLGFTWYMVRLETKLIVFGLTVTTFLK